MTAEVKTKYTTIRFCEELGSGFAEDTLYVSVDFAWGEKADSLALLFALNMDKVVEAEVRKRMAEKLSIEPIRDIALEDTWLMIQGYSQDEKHLTTEIIPIVRAAEAEFDRMLQCDPTKL